MASDSLAALSNVSPGMLAGGAFAFGVAAIVLGFVRRARRSRVSYVDFNPAKKPWAYEIRDGAVDAREASRLERRTSTYVNPVDVWTPSDLERGLTRIPGPPTVMREIAAIDEVQPKLVLQEEIKDESQPRLVDHEEEMRDLSPPSANENFACTFPGCGKQYSLQSELKHHVRHHEKPVACQACPRSFPTTKDLRRHINSVHETTRTWYCTVVGCKFSKISTGGVGGKSFTRKDNWRRHMKDIHGRRDENLDMDVDD